VVASSQISPHVLKVAAKVTLFVENANQMDEKLHDDVLAIFRIHVRMLFRYG